MYRIVLVATICLLVAIFTSTPSLAEKRVALVIGNSNYQHVATLTNPANDARLIAGVLRSQNFEVIERLNLTQKEMKRAIQTFTRKIKRYGYDTVGLVFYAGHGLQIRGLNYLIPVDAQIETAGDVDINAISASSLLFGLNDARNRLNVIIFDACRNNPYRGVFRDASRGLARMGAPTGSLVAFSTAPGDVAADGPKGGNSPYSATLAKYLAQPGLRIEDVFKSTRQYVYRLTKERQVPWESSSIIGNFYPAGPGRAVPRPTDLSLFNGEWHGTLRQPKGRVKQYPIRLTVDPTTETYRVVYESLKCGGEGRLLELTKNSVLFEEQITYGRSRCIDGQIKLRLPQNGVLNVVTCPRL